MFSLVCAWLASIIQISYNGEKEERSGHMYQIRLAKESDLPAILQIYADARAFMARTGNPNQWGSHHPPKAMLEEDIRIQKLHVVTRDDQVEGVFYFTLDPDPTYAEIYDGVWHSDQQYGTIHRIASGGNKGIFRSVLEFCLKQCPYIRIDTHHDNAVMQHVLDKHGFRRCGIIYLADGQPRIAYDRI